jgi:hypothetical protein
MKAQARKKAVTTQRREKKVTKPPRKKVIAPKTAAFSKPRPSAPKQQRKAIAPPRVISRRYLSPLGKGEISSRRITAAIKAVKKAHALYDVEM